MWSSVSSPCVSIRWCLFISILHGFCTSFCTSPSSFSFESCCDSFGCASVTDSQAQAHERSGTCFLCSCICCFCSCIFCISLGKATHSHTHTCTCTCTYAQGQGQAQAQAQDEPQPPTKKHQCKQRCENECATQTRTRHRSVVCAECCAQSTRIGARVFGSVCFAPQHHRASARIRLFAGSRIIKGLATTTLPIQSPCTCTCTCKCKCKHKCKCVGV